MSILGFKVINYGHMFSFQDLFCIFERTDVVSLNTLHNEKEYFKKFLISIGKLKSENKNGK